MSEYTVDAGIERAHMWSSSGLEDASIVPVYLGEIRALAAEVERLRSAQEWQPIETAPRDRVSVILYRSGCNRVDVGFYQDDRHAKKPRPFWQSDFSHVSITEARGNPPTLWKPLPPPLTNRAER